MSLEQWEERFSVAPRTIAVYREECETPVPQVIKTRPQWPTVAPESISAPCKVPDRPKPAPRTSTARYFTFAQVHLPCSDGNPHTWERCGPNKAGTEMARCAKCTGRTTALNAGFAIPRKAQVRKVIPERVPLRAARIPACVNPAGHRWMKNGGRREYPGCVRLKCSYCKKCATDYV